MPTVAHPRSVQAAPGIALRDYQREALAAIHAAAARGIARQLVVLPTGTGKTVVFGALIAGSPGRALVLAHRDELITQAVDKLLMAAPGLEVGIVKGERDDTGAPVVVASVQTLARPPRLARLRPDFALVVVDEAHHAAADSYRRVLDYVEAPLVVGMTATPERADGVPLDGWRVVYRRELLEMISAGYLADLRAIQVRLAADFHALHTRAGDVIDREAEELLLAADAPHHAVAAYQAHAAGRKALLFTPTVRVAHAMAEAFENAGVAATAIDGETPTDARRATLRQFGAGAVRVVANCGVLTEGFDEPSADCILIARPTRSRSLYVQMIGRGTRPFPGKGDCLILDLVGATTRHDLMTAAAVLGVTREQTLAERGVRAALDEERRDQLRLQHEGQLVAQDVDLFRRRPLHWIAAGPGCFLLSLGEAGSLVLEQQDARWRVVVRERSGARVLADALPLDYAQGTAEDYARRSGAGAFVDPNAAWRSAPATDRQIAALRRWQIPSRADLTKGAASDLLTAAVSGRAR
jgi:superfamily II DNA or RNA helicase